MTGAGKNAAVEILLGNEMRFDVKSRFLSRGDEFFGIGERAGCIVDAMHGDNLVLAGSEAIACKCWG